MPVKLNDVIEALDEAAEECSHYLDRNTGEIVMMTNEEMEAAEKDELISEYPDWQREAILKAREVFKSEDFIELPGRFDIDEYKLMEDFCLELKNRQVGEHLLRLIKGSGAFGRFKDGIYSLAVEKDWYRFRREELERIAIQWLEDQKIPYTRGDSTAAEEAVM